MIKLTKKRALELAKGAIKITMSDPDFNIRDEEVSYERMIREIEQFAGRSFKTWQDHDIVSISFAGIHFGVYLK